MQSRDPSSERGMGAVSRKEKEKVWDAVWRRLMRRIIQREREREKVCNCMLFVYSWGKKNIWRIPEGE